MFRPQSISSSDARKYFTKIINKVSFSSKSFVVQTYRQPIVRIVNENYINVLEEVLGKKTVNQVMQIAGNDQLFESEKIEQIKKVFQRRLSSSSRPERGRGAGSPPQQPQRKQDKNVVASPVTPKPQTHLQTQQPQHRPKDGRPLAKKPVTVAARHASPPVSKPQQSKQPTPIPQAPKPKPQNRKQGKRVLFLQNGKNYK